MTTSLVLGAAKQLRGLPGLDRGPPLLKGKRLRERSASKFYTFLCFNAVSRMVTRAEERFKTNSRVCLVPQCGLRCSPLAALGSRSSLQQERLFGRERKYGMDPRPEESESSQNTDIELRRRRIRSS